jgi:hypothetical protein
MNMASSLAATTASSEALSERSFVRLGGLAGVLLALGSLAAVAIYYTLVPTAQRLPITDANAYLASLAQEPTGTLLFQGVYAFLALCALVGIIATYYHIRQLGEAWAFFATLVGAIAAAGTVLSSVYQFANLQYLAAHPAIGQQTAATFDAPTPVNPLGVMGFGLTAIWFLVIGLFFLRGANQPWLLGVLALVAFADLIAGFVASAAGIGPVMLGAALIAGAVGGPIFWLWQGLRLWRDA